jgi:hypothetical protein
MEFLSKEMKKKFTDSAKDWKEKGKAEKKAAKELEKAAAKEKKITDHEAAKGDIKAMLGALWNDEEKGIDTKKELFDAAKKENKMITMQDIEDFLRPQEASHIKDTPGYNSYVASLPREQYHVDIAYITKADKSTDGPKTEEDTMPPEEGAEEEAFPVPLAAPKAKAKAKAKAKPKGLNNIPTVWGSKAKAFICVDVFSKKVFVEPVDGTTAEDAKDGMLKAFYVMGPPKEVFTDDGGEFKGVFDEYLKAQGVKHITTRRHAMFAERFTRYLRFRLRQRQLKFNKQWESLVHKIVQQYNSNPHTTTHMSPNEAQDDRNALDVKLQLVMQAKRDRKYPPLHEGDQVKIYQKKSRGEEKKEIVPVWQGKIYTVKQIEWDDGKEYFELDPRPQGLKAKYLRHELMKVS